MGTNPCFHCQEPLPPTGSLAVTVAGKPHEVCCAGCRAAVEWIHGQGLGDYYRLRSDGAGPGRGASTDFSVFDRPAVLRYYAGEAVDGICSITLALDGMRCAACTWLIERALASEPGVLRVKVQALTQRVTLRWRVDAVQLSTLAGRLAVLGYTPHLADPTHVLDRIKRERRESLKRLVVAGVGMMQAMMYGVALYAGAFEGMDPTVRDFFRWVSMAVAAPVIFYSGQPFFSGAWREFKARRLGMDTPVALALALAFAASIFESSRGGAEVYFDSLTMFVFFLLLGRFAEQGVRHRAQVSLGVLSSGLPPLARRIEGEATVEVATLELEAGDQVQVAAGCTIPVDGELLEAHAEVDEALLTGESRPVEKRIGELLLAGSVAVSRPLRLRVLRTGAATLLSSLARMADDAQSEKPASLAMAERVARFFIARVLIFTVLVGLVWLWLVPERAFAVALSVLVVSCPCALSLALPTALAAASQGLGRLGVLVVRPAALETLAQVRQVVFDKTGTLTDGRIRITGTTLAPGSSAEQVRAIAATLEREATHPIARAFASELPLMEASERRQVAGQGVEAVIAGQRYRLGRAGFAFDGSAPAAPSLEGDVHLSVDGRALAAFSLEDQLRSDASDALRELRSAGLGTVLLSGDSPARVAAVAARLDFADWHADQQPAAKIEVLERLQAAHGPALMVGDGVNDAPVLGRAAVSVAMGQGADLAKAHADLILLGSRLRALPQALHLAQRSMAVIRQNIRWSYAYNALAIPAAALGLVPPWLAAIGMSASSIVVVWNSMRLLRVRRPATVAGVLVNSTAAAPLSERA
ncbi:MAG TPA: heavy metal translocating P-type ATPase [Xanthomonadales bacterium]|nr:heavy metal translocating P-type ATPase [Xanthomonadales bacterium]